MKTKFPKEIGVYWFVDGKEKFLTAMELSKLKTDETVEHLEKIAIYELKKIKTFVRGNELVD